MDFNSNDRYFQAQKVGTGLKSARNFANSAYQHHKHRNNKSAKGRTMQELIQKALRITQRKIRQEAQPFQNEPSKHEELKEEQLPQYWKKLSQQQQESLSVEKASGELWLYQQWMQDSIFAVLEETTDKIVKEMDLLGIGMEATQN